jgi:hypothetical protein
MMNEEKKPKKDDAVLGGNNPPPVDGLVLGGIEGLKLKFERANSEIEKISLLKDALKYGEAGRNWLFEIITKEFGNVLWEAFDLLWKNFDEVARQELNKYLPKLLKEDIFKWNEWRNSNTSFKINFSGIIVIR